MIHALRCHPDTPPQTVAGVDVRLHLTDGDDIGLSFAVRGSDRLVVPRPASPARADRLWTTTCFECFLRPKGGEAYIELNFSPSGCWAAYAFERYRSGMRDFAMTVEPLIEIDGEAEPGTFGCDADLDLSDLPHLSLQMALCAVIEETGGHKSYWALAHPPGPPDFHHPDCFVAKLPAAGAP